MICLFQPEYVGYENIECKTSMLTFESSFSSSNALIISVFIRAIKIMPM